MSRFVFNVLLASLASSALDDRYLRGARSDLARRSHGRGILMGYQTEDESTPSKETEGPTADPTPAPTPAPTFEPTSEETEGPTADPTPAPTPAPTFEPTSEETEGPRTPTRWTPRTRLGRRERRWPCPAQQGARTATTASVL